MGFLLIPIFYSLAEPPDPTYGLNATAGQAYGRDPGTLEKNPITIIGIIMGMVLAGLGVIFLTQVIIAGISWMTAQGNEEKITKAKQNLYHSIIGLLIVMAAYAIVNYVFGGLMKAIMG